MVIRVDQFERLIFLIYDFQNLSKAICIYADIHTSYISKISSKFSLASHVYNLGKRYIFIVTNCIQWNDQTDRISSFANRSLTLFLIEVG